LSQGESRGDNSLNSSVIGQVDEENNTIHRSINFEVSLEETSSLHIYTHSSEDKPEVVVRMVVHVLVLNKGGLTANLSTDRVMWETSG
jgi:hypothetical protein